MMKIIILIIASFIWLIFLGQKSFNEILKILDKYSSCFLFKILQLFMLIFILRLMFGIAETIYIKVKNIYFCN